MCLGIVAAAAPVSIAYGTPPVLIVSAEASGEIVLVDPDKAKVIESIKVGPRPRGLKLSRDGRSLFVAVAGPPKPAAPAGAGLAVIDVAAKKVSKHVATAPTPFGVDISRDGRTAFVSSSASNELLVVDVAAGSVKKKVPVGMDPQGVTVHPDGKVVYVVTHGADEIYVIDVKTMNLLWRIGAGSRPQTLLFAPRGAMAFVTDEGLPSLTIVDGKKNTFKEEFILPGLAKTSPAPALQSAVFSPDGKQLYVTTGPGKSVLILDPVKKAVVGTITGVGGFPRGIAIRSDGKKLYTANGPSNDVAVIDVASQKVEARVAVPGAPFAIVVSR
jgi:YVTN family beta-propeller protein